MKATVLVSAIVLLAFLGVGLSAGPPAAQQTQREKKEFRTPEMDGLIKAIHADLMELKKTQPWLAEYDGKCLNDDGTRIFYMERQRQPVGDKNTPLPQPPLPSHILITYHSIDAVTVPKDVRYGNVLEKTRACHFPTLKAKVYATILVRKDTAVAETIRTCIIKQCESLHKKLKSEKAAKE
jgi:hypothetical protein